MENEVLKSPSEFDVSSAIKKWRSQGFSKEMIELARNDMSEYGMPFKQVSIYMDVKLSAGQAEQLSQALRNEVNEDFVRHLAEGGYSAEQIKTILRFTSEVPVDVIEKNVTSDMKAHAISKALQAVKDSLAEAKQAVPEENEKVKEVLDSISEQLSALSQNAELIEKVSKKLDEMTYKMYYKIAKVIEDNPEFDTTAGSKAIINYETLHPHNISQKTAIMLEHFMNVTRHKIGGRAKAMVVTPSRLHAVRYVQEFKRQIKEKGLNDLEVLVAFSGEVEDNDDVFTEEGMNKDKEGKTIKEKALPETFHTDDYGILVVAEKYQTGFDEPLLHTMFVDKKLSGVKAVQTLSRLNRTTRGKVDTFVLDFVNSAEDIKASFEPFYEETVLLEETDPNVVYDMKNTLDDFRVYQKSEVDKFADIFYQSENQSAGDLGKLQGQLRPAVDRYEVLEVEKQDIFKSTLASFNRIYAYITQVCRLFDKDIHRFSIYSKFLYTMLPKGHGGEKINIDDKVLLEYYKLEKDFEGPIELESTEGGYTPISGDSGHREPKKDPLTVIIDKINEKYGTHFTEMDKVLVQMENDYANQEKWQSYAKNNDRATFMLLFEKDFPNMAADRYEQNDQFFRKLFDDPDMMKQVMETVGSVLYERLKKKYVFDPKSGVVEEATPETYVEDTYLTKA